MWPDGPDLHGLLPLTIDWRTIPVPIPQSTPALPAVETAANDPAQLPWHVGPVSKDITKSEPDERMLGLDECWTALVAVKPEDDDAQTYVDELLSRGARLRKDAESCIRDHELAGQSELRSRVAGMLASKASLEEAVVQLAKSIQAEASKPKQRLTFTQLRDGLLAINTDAAADAAIRERASQLVSVFLGWEVAVSAFIGDQGDQHRSQLEREMDEVNRAGRAQESRVEAAQRAVRTAEHELRNATAAEAHAIGLYHSAVARQRSLSDFASRGMRGKAHTDVAAHGAAADRATGKKGAANGYLNSAMQALDKERRVLEELRSRTQKLKGRLSGRPYRDNSTGLPTQGLNS